MVGPASTSCTEGRPGARPWLLAASGSISASSPASSTPVAPPPPTTTVARRCCSGPVAAAAAVSALPTAAHTCSAPPAGQVETIDLGLHEADPRGQHILERDAHRVGGAGAGGDPGQLGKRQVVIVPVNQGQLHLGVVAQLGR